MGTNCFTLLCAWLQYWYEADVVGGFLRKKKEASPILSAPVLPYRYSFLPEFNPVFNL
jgi:hypothetical protein